MAFGIDKKNQILTIAIPTFNRSTRLEKSLNDLLSQIKKSGKRQYISVFVSDNGSSDNTYKIAEKQREIFLNNNISFSINVFSENQGFDANVLCCYRNCSTDYIWFLSDDDNILDGSINVIIQNIKKFAPNVLYYNFDQYPYKTETPLIKDSILYNSVNKNNIQSISKIVSSPKLTSLVIRKKNDLTDKFSSFINLNYMHIALALQTGFDFGKIYHSKKFIACPDDDFIDHIDFVPYIGNDLVETVIQILKLNNKPDLYKYFQLKKMDPVISSMATLGLYFNDNFVVKKELRFKLYMTIKNGIKVKHFFIPQFIKVFIKLIIGYIIFLLRKVKLKNK